ncbi:hypothetical protein QGM71_01305 [Virgibacillus sp. C22-A2]|uniref:Uncharacterized protein n=1 Tax=Virgibacillus tibetensis TaxID=3042313 RepID=A0ABU6KA56_9BACI|nr:hypothetical protein [Virgibacillus sp. C22-A2]
MRNATRCGITVDRFWDMTIKEILLEIKGYNFRLENEMELHAHFAAQIINSNRGKGKTYKGTDLFNPNKADNVVSIEEHKKRFEEANALMGADAIPVRRRQVK